MARPRFAFTCKQHQRTSGLERRHCNTQLRDWQLVEDPAAGVGIWATTCSECGTFITVEMSRTDEEASA